MVKVQWQDVIYQISRIVIADDVREHYQYALAPVAERYDLEISNDCTSPRTGDFWIGCSPKDGWENADPFLTAWASGLEIRHALFSLNATLPRHRRAIPSVTRFAIPRLASARLAFA